MPLLPEDEIQAVLKKHNLKIVFEPYSDEYKQFPVEVQLALEVLQKHKISMRAVLADNPKA